MSLFGALSVASSGLKVASGQMQIVSDNLANATKEGYSKKSAVVISVTNGPDVAGAKIAAYTRLTDDSTARALQQANAAYGLSSTQLGYQQQVQTLLGLTNTATSATLSDKLNAFQASWAQLQAEPESTVQQKDVLGKASDLAATIRSLAASVEALDRTVKSDTQTAVTDLNNNLQNIKDLNDQISDAISHGNPSGDLEDARDAIIQQVAGMMNITVLQREQGRVALYTSAGYNLVDSKAVQFGYDGITVSAVTNPGYALNNILVGGSLQAQMNFRADTSPASASIDPNTEVIRKLREQLDAVVTAFTASTAGPPESFAHAYNSATALNGTELTSGFFSGSNRIDFDVNASLLDGTKNIKQNSAVAITATFNDSTKSFTAAGLNLSGASYADLGANILSQWQQAANNASDRNTPYKSQVDFLKQKLADNTGVNTDQETLSLTTLESSYNASAKVISVITEMLKTLENIV